MAGGQASRGDHGRRVQRLRAPGLLLPADGVLPVSLAAGTRSVLAFETTSDGGRCWTPAATVKIGKSLAFGSAVPAAVVDESYWLAAAGRGSWR